MTNTTKHSCCATVYSGMWPGKCSKAGAYAHEGRHYCKIHHPPNVMAKEEAQRAERVAKEVARLTAYAERAEQERRANCYPDLLAALEDMDKWLKNTRHDEDHPWRISLREAINNAKAEFRSSDSTT